MKQYLSYAFEFLFIGKKTSWEVMGQSQHFELSTVVDISHFIFIYNVIFLFTSIILSTTVLQYTRFYLKLFTLSLYFVKILQYINSIHTQVCNVCCVQNAVKKLGENGCSCCDGVVVVVGTCMSSFYELYDYNDVDYYYDDNYFQHVYAFEN